ncbi:putative entry exclusion protein TrbK-alt [Klebsiella pneumoniae]|uniref:putative entry exclusion protein TrbK-alt n=1 Tax=Klebsiella pneumoniae TaxID=573 RepID=UPI003D6AD167
MLARTAVIAVAAIIVTAAALGLPRKVETTELPSRLFIQPDHNALREGQRRCQRLGQKASDDAGCLRVWAETRDRFLGRTGPTPQTTGTRH